MRANEAGHAFEDRVAEKLRSLGLRAWTRRKLSWALNAKADPQLGEVDVLAASADNRRLWVIEAKDLRFCRTEAEVSARLAEYRGRMITDAQGRTKPDKMLRHIRRVQYLRARHDAVCARLGLDVPPAVNGLLIVDSPQPMNFYMLEQVEDGQSAFLDTIEQYHF
jgi:Holliday junction resolvase-like predicted endonuclease